MHSHESQVIPKLVALPVSFTSNMILATVVDANKMRLARFLKLKEAQGIFFVHRGGKMKHVFSHEGKTH